MPDIEQHQILSVEEGADPTKHKLLPKEGFVFSQIDGKLTFQDLKLVTGTQDKELQRILGRLIELGLVNLQEGESVSTSSGATTAIPLRDDKRSLEERVAELYINIDNIDHFSLFGLDRSAQSQDIKKAFHLLTKEYHPDKLFRRGSDDIRERLQYIFARINTAYKVLSNNQSRWEYEKSLGPVALPSKARPAAKTPSREPTPPPKKPSGPPTPPPKQPTPPPVNPFSETVMKAKRIYEEAMKEIKKKNYAAAKNNLRIASTLDPFNKAYPETIRKVEELESKNQAEKHFEEGLAKEREKKWDEAIRSYREATLLDGDNPKYYTKWARILIEEKNNSSQAKSVIDKAFDLAQKDPEQYLVMGMVYKEMGQRPKAQSQFEHGLKIDPSNKDLQRELKKIKKGK